MNSPFLINQFKPCGCCGDVKECISGAIRLEVAGHTTQGRLELAQHAGECYEEETCKFTLELVCVGVLSMLSMCLCTGVCVVCCGVWCGVCCVPCMVRLCVCVVYCCVLLFCCMYCCVHCVSVHCCACCVSVRCGSLPWFGPSTNGIACLYIEAWPLAVWYLVFAGSVGAFLGL